MKFYLIYGKYSSAQVFNETVSLCSRGMKIALNCVILIYRRMPAIIKLPTKD
jgi:hypothetical protein